MERTKKIVLLQNAIEQVEEKEGSGKKGGIGENVIVKICFCMQVFVHMCVKGVCVCVDVEVWISCCCL